jgi:large subunit ribosomal protein LP1
VEMAVFTFIAKESGGTWIAKQFGGEHSLEETASSTFELQRKLVNLALQTAGSNTVSSSFSVITPTSAVAQVLFFPSDVVFGF